MIHLTHPGEARVWRVEPRQGVDNLVFGLKYYGFCEDKRFTFILLAHKKVTCSSKSIMLNNQLNAAAAHEYKSLNHSEQNIIIIMSSLHRGIFRLINQISIISGWNKIGN